MNNLHASHCSDFEIQLPPAFRSDPEAQRLASQLAARVNKHRNDSSNSAKNTVPALSKECTRVASNKSASDAFAAEDQMTRGGKPEGNWIDD